MRPLPTHKTHGEIPATPANRRRGLTGLVWAWLLTLACSHRGANPAPPPPPTLSPPAIAALVDVARESARVPDREAWGQAVHDALAANQIPSTALPACAVLAVIAQESGFQADPVVPGLAKVVATRIDNLQAKLGPLGRPIFERVLAGRSPGNPRTFEQRLQTVRTERDLDLVFRDMLAFYEGNYPATFEALTMAGKLFDLGDIHALNPITTAGPMQVSVRFAETVARQRHADLTRVRDELYTRAGGVYYGTAALFAGAPSYPRYLFRFADYNAGPFASRNAAVQEQLTQLTGRRLTLDGDLLAYGKDGDPTDDVTQSMAALRAFRDTHAPHLSDRRLRKDALLEKTLALEGTETYRAIKSTYLAKLKRPPAYARLPDVVLDSPKLTRKLSTAWFARAVDRRFAKCLAAAGARETIATE
ncbi:MAG TPA: DUF1615 family protein [Polyangia bacterium]